MQHQQPSLFRIVSFLLLSFLWIVPVTEALMSQPLADPFTIISPRVRLAKSTDITDHVGATDWNADTLLTCRQNFGEIPVTVTFNDPAIVSPTNMLYCQGTMRILFLYTITAPGLKVVDMTITSSFGSTTTQLFIHGVPDATVPSWVIDPAPGTSIISVVDDSARQLVYLSDIGTHAVLVFSRTQRAIIKRIPVGRYPYNMVKSLDNTRLYVANTGSFSISVIDLTTQNVIEEIPLPSLHPNPLQPFEYLYAPFELAMLNDTTLLLGSNPPGFASGSVLYQFDLTRRVATPAFGSGGHVAAGANPVFRTSSDSKIIGIVLEPGSSPTTILQYNRLTDTLHTFSQGINRSLALNADGSRMVVTYNDCSNWPNLGIFDAQLRKIQGIDTVGCQTLAAVIHPKEQHLVYGTDGRSPTIDESDMTTGLQRRRIVLSLPQDFFFVPYGQPLTIASDGRWLFAALSQPVPPPGTPQSKLLLVFIGEPYQVYLPAIQ